MRELWNAFLRLFTSLQLTVVLLVFSIVLVFVATLDQVNLGIWAVQEKYFRSFFVMWPVPDTRIAVPLFPGGYFIGGLLLLNLVAAHVKRFKFTWGKAGLFLTHAGLILLLVGELLTGLWQEDYTMQLSKGETRNYSESQREQELAIIDTTDPKEDAVLSIPEGILSSRQGIQHPKLPFRIQIKAYYPNSNLQMRREGSDAPPSLATAGVGRQILATPAPMTYKSDERNIPTVFVELAGAEGSLGTYLVSPVLEMPQGFSYAGRTYSLTMRPLRVYHAFNLTLNELRHDVYPGSEIPRNFSSRVRLKTADGREDHEVVVYMNNPLRHDGFTFYQYQMNQASNFSVLQVVRNPSWLMPYVSCMILTAGLFMHFCISLMQFVRRRTRGGAVTAA